MKWITRERIKVDRVACPWLIRHFVDREAEFVFLRHDTDWAKIDNGAGGSRATSTEKPERVDEPGGESINGIVFDVPNCELGHHGQDVSFNSILKKYNLTEPALVLLGEIVRAADSRPRKPHPAGEGLRWIAHGFSAMGWSDQEILAREFPVYDALYAECKQHAKANRGIPCYGITSGSIFEILSKVR